VRARSGAGSPTRFRPTRRTVDASVAFADRDPAVAADAAADRDARAVAVDGDSVHDVVCLAVPMSAVPAAVKAYTPRAEQAIVDVSGEMTRAVAAMREHAPGLERASYHPLFAPPRVPGNVAVVVDEPGPAVAAVSDAVEAGGNDVFETTADEHDAAMETVQAGAHAAVLAWRLAGDDVREEFPDVVDGRARRCRGHRHRGLARRVRRDTARVRRR